LIAVRNSAGIPPPVAARFGDPFLVRFLQATLWSADGEINDVLEPERRKSRKSTFLYLHRLAEAQQN